MHPTQSALLAARRAFAAAVLAERKSRGLSQEEFAELCDLHRNDIGRIERAEINVSLDNAIRIAAALGVNVSTFFDRAGL